MKKDKISDKCSFLKDVTSTSDEDFANEYAKKFPNENGDDFKQTFKRYRNGKRDEWYVKKDKRKDWSLERIARVFGTSPEQLKFNPYFTRIIKVRMALEGIEKISIDSDILEFFDNLEENEYILEEMERKENIEFIIAEYNNMNILDCYKLLIFYDDYKKISGDSWSVIYDYAHLNEKGKIKLRNYIYSKSKYNIVKFDIRFLDKTDSQLLTEIYKKTHSKDETRIRQLLDKLFEKKITKEVGYYLFELKERIAELPTVDLIDVMLVESYSSLNYNEQQNVLKKCTELIKNPEYSNVVEL